MSETTQNYKENPVKRNIQKEILCEFLDTFTHELRHLADDIAMHIGIDLRGEEVAYMTGDTARDLADVVCRLGCPHCND